MKGNIKYITCSICYINTIGSGRDKRFVYLIFKNTHIFIIIHNMIYIQYRSIDNQLYEAHKNLVYYNNT